MAALTRTIAPVAEPVQLADIQAQARVETYDEIGLINRYMRAAREWVENYTERSLITQTWRQTLDRAFPDTIRLFRGPVQAISDFTYVDQDGIEQTLDAAVYDTDLNSDPALIMLAENQVWPQVRDQLGAITVTYTAGYGDTADDVPEQLRLAIMQLGTFWYDNRASVIVGDRMSPTPFGVTELLDQYRIFWQQTMSEPRRSWRSAWLAGDV